MIAGPSVPAQDPLVADLTCNGNRSSTEQGHDEKTGAPEPAVKPAGEDRENRAGQTNPTVPYNA
jgi:hypothetical protein